MNKKYILYAVMLMFSMSVSAGVLSIGAGSSDIGASFQMPLQEGYGSLTKTSVDTLTKTNDNVDNASINVLGRYKSPGGDWIDVANISSLPGNDGHSVTLPATVSLMKVGWQK